jgi:hypothetical protein
MHGIIIQITANQKFFNCICEHVLTFLSLAYTVHSNIYLHNIYIVFGSMSDLGII